MPQVALHNFKAMNIPVHIYRSVFVFTDLRTHTLLDLNIHKFQHICKSDYTFSEFWTYLQI